MGQLLGAGCCVQGAEESVVEEFVPLCNVEVRVGSPKELATAQRELLKALEHYQANQHTHAAEKLASAEHMLSVAEKRTEDATFWNAYEHDPGLKALRDEVSHLDDCLQKCTSVGKGMLEKRCKEMAQTMLASSPQPIIDSVSDWCEMSLAADSFTGNAGVASSRLPSSDTQDLLRYAAASKHPSIPSSVSRHPSSSEQDQPTHFRSAMLPRPSDRSAGWLRPTQARKEHSKVTFAEAFESGQKSVALCGEPSKFSNLGSTPEEEDLQDPVPKLEASLQEVRALCLAARVFDAYSSLQVLELDVAAAFQVASASLEKLEDKIRGFSGRMAADELITRLRLIHEHMETASGLLKAAERIDDKWAKVHIDDPTISPDFNLDVSMKFAEGEERDPKGPSTQVLIIARLHSFPFALHQQIATLCEMDLWQKEWIKDCKHVEAQLGEAERLYSSLVTVNLSPAGLPLQIEDLQIRELSVCTMEPLPGFGPGVMVLEASPPEKVKVHDGWTIPAPSRHGVRVSGTKVHYYSPCAGNSSCIDITTSIRFGIPVHRWLLPLDLVKRIIADSVKTSFKKIKAGAVDNWSQLKYESRIKQRPKLYDPLILMEQQVALSR